MALKDLNEDQKQIILGLIDREIIGLDTAINANNEMMEEYKQDNPELANRITLGNDSLQRQMERLKEIENTIHQPSEEDAHGQVGTQSE